MLEFLGIKERRDSSRKQSKREKKGLYIYSFAQRGANPGVRAGPLISKSPVEIIGQLKVNILAKFNV